MKTKKLKYQGSNFELGEVWNKYFTIGKIYMCRKDHGDFYEVKCDDGNIKLVPKEVFNDSTLEVELEFNEMIIRLLGAILKVAAGVFILIGIFVDPFYLVFGMLAAAVVLITTPFKKNEKRQPTRGENPQAPNQD